MAKLTANPAKAATQTPPRPPRLTGAQGTAAQAAAVAAAYNTHKAQVLAAAAAQVQAHGQAPAIAAAQAPSAPAMPSAPAPTVQATQATANAAHVVVAVQVRGTPTGASAPRKAAGYAVGRTVQQCRAAGVTAADIRWDMLRPGKQGPHANIVLAAPGTAPALAAQALLGGALPRHRCRPTAPPLRGPCPPCLRRSTQALRQAPIAPPQWPRPRPRLPQARPRPCRAPTGARRNPLLYACNITLKAPRKRGAGPALTSHQFSTIFDPCPEQPRLHRT